MGLAQKYKIMNILTKISDFFGFASSKIDIKEGYCFYSDDCMTKGTIYFQGKVLLKNVVYYADVENGIFLRTIDYNKASNYHFYDNYGDEPKVVKYNYGFKVFWDIYPMGVWEQYFDFAGNQITCDIKEVKKYVSKQDKLICCFIDGYSIYKKKGINKFVDNKNVVELFQSNYKIRKYGSFLIVKSDKKGPFFDVFSIFDRKIVMTIDFNNLIIEDYDVLRMRYLIDRIRSNENFMKEQSYHFQETDTHIMFCWSSLKKYEIYEKNVFRLITYSSIPLFIFENGYKREVIKNHINSNNSFFYDFDNKEILKSVWDIEVHNGVLSILQRQSEGFFHEVYNLEGIYIGKIQVERNELYNGDPHNIKGIKEVKIISNELGVQFVLDSGVEKHYHKDGYCIKSINKAEICHVI